MLAEVLTHTGHDFTGPYVLLASFASCGVQRHGVIHRTTQLCLKWNLSTDNLMLPFQPPEPHINDQGVDKMKKYLKTPKLTPKKTAKQTIGRNPWIRPHSRAQKA